MGDDFDDGIIRTDTIYRRGNITKHVMKREARILWLVHSPYLHCQRINHIWPLIQVYDTAWQKEGRYAEYEAKYVRGPQKRYN